MLAGTTAVHADGIPGLRGHDHTGITVPDIKQAADFFINVLGCKEAMSFGPFADEKGNFMADLLNVNPRAVIHQITLEALNSRVFDWRVSPEFQASDIKVARPDAEEQACQARAIGCAPLEIDPALTRLDLVDRHVCNTPIREDRSWTIDTTGAQYHGGRWSRQRSPEQEQSHSPRARRWLSARSAAQHGDHSTAGF
jgi:hypothetical protein